MYGRTAGYIAAVRFANTVVVACLLVLWLPASSHALLEHAGWIHEGDTHHEHSPAEADHHDVADGICRVESNTVQAPTPCFSDAASFFALTLLASSIADIANVIEYSGPSPPGKAPPEFQVSWQFSHRAAVPVRAPSLLS